jgi:tetratricopeptide (TPR) repeat protein
MGQVKPLDRMCQMRYNTGPRRKLCEPRVTTGLRLRAITCNGREHIAVSYRGAEDPSSVWAWVRGLGTVVVLLFLIFVSIAGVAVYQGLQKRAALRREAASEHYARGLVHMQANRHELAIAEFEMALQLDPSVEGARARLAEAQRGSYPAPTPVPTPQPEKTRSMTDQLYAQAQSCYESEDWEGALAALEELRNLEPDYEAQAVAAMLYDLFYRQGQALAAEDRLEEALRSLDQALTWSPESEEALEQRERLSLYLAGLGFWEADWARATETLAQLYALDAGYRDVADRLHRAHLAYGDYAVEQGEWCLAVSQYGQALEIKNVPGIQEKRAEASERCAMASAPSPIQPATHITATEGEQPTPAQGTLALTLYDPQLNAPALYLIRFDPTGGPRWVRLGEGLCQPAFSPDGARLAVRSMVAGQEGLRIIDRSGQVVASLPGTAQGMQPTWSPDGQRVAFVVPGDDAHSGRIYTISASGQEEPEEMASGWAPAWGPQGWFAYTACGEEECGIRVLPPDAGEPMRITASPRDVGLAWSPDGQWLAYMSDHDGDWELHVTTREGWVQQVTVNESRDGLPVWSLDGSALAFGSALAGGWGLYLLRPDGAGWGSPGQACKVFDISTDYDGRWDLAQIAWGP